MRDPFIPVLRLICLLSLSACAPESVPTPGSRVAPPLILPDGAEAAAEAIDGETLSAIVD